jgi:hypothetical protein
MYVLNLHNLSSVQSYVMHSATDYIAAPLIIAIKSGAHTGIHFTYNLN